MRKKSFKKKKWKFKSKKSVSNSLKFNAKQMTLNLNKIFKQRTLKKKLLSSIIKLNVKQTLKQRKWKIYS